MELSDKGFKETIIKILQPAIMITCGTNEKIGAQQIKNVKKNKQCRIENTITEIKYSLRGLSSRMKMIEERISKIGDRSVEIIQIERQRANRFLKNKPVWRGC